MSKELERHARLGQYLKDIVFSANDGIITTFAVVSGAIGANLSPAVVVIIGLASMIADGFSMATGNYLGTKTEQDFYFLEEQRERQEVKKSPEKEKEEIQKIFSEKGFSGPELDSMVRLTSSKENYWVDFMMKEELGLHPPSAKQPLLHAVATFFSFIIAGAIPLIPYLVLTDGGNSFFLAAVFSGSSLFIVGALRRFFSTRSWVLSGLEMLIVGGSAALIAYAIGFALKAILS